MRTSVRGVAACEMATGDPGPRPRRPPSASLFMPRLPQRTFFYAALRPFGAVVAVAGLVLALTGSSSGAIPATVVTAAHPEAPALHVSTPAVAPRAPVHTARSLQRSD